MQEIIKWYETKKKLYTVSDLAILKKYVIKTEQNIAKTINFSSDYEFKYFDLDLMDCEKIKVRPENIFKINFQMIVKKLQQYFLNCKIEINFEASSDNDFLLKKNNCTYKHDICIKVTNNLDNESYDIGLEYFEFIHDRIKDDDKEISSRLILDGYYVYNESSKQYNEFMKETIYNIMITICALTDDPYTLSKINYFANYKNIRSLKADTEIFNKIINWKKTNTGDFKKLFDNFMIINPENGKEFEFNEFIEHIENNFNIVIKFTNETNCEYKYFVDFIVQVNTDYSQHIYSYRKIYARTMEILIETQKQMIKWIKQMNNSRKLVPKYIDSFLRVHIQNYRYTDTQKKALNNLTKKLKQNNI